MGSYDEFLEGVPHVRSGLGSSMFERSPLSSRTRLHLARNQDGATSEILASRERLEVLREAARSRAQAPRALDALTRLDPASDPDYQTKVMGVLAQNPDAARDQRIANFLGMQGGIFKRAEHDRDRDEQRDWMRGEDERRYRLGLDRDEERYGIQDKRQTEFDEKRYQIEKKRRDEEDIKRRYEALPKEYRKEWDERGLNDRTPEEKRSNLLFIEETLRHKDAVNKARASGLTETEIQGLMKDGRLDESKLAALTGERVRTERDRKDVDMELKEKKARISLIQSVLDNPDSFDEGEEGDNQRRSFARELARLAMETDGQLGGDLDDVARSESSAQTRSASTGNGGKGGGDSKKRLDPDKWLDRRPSE